MTRPWFDVVSENNVYERINRQEQANSRYKQGATPQVAANAGAIHRQAPWLTPSQVLALAKGNASPQAVDLAGELQGKVLPQKLQDGKERSWFERNVKDKLKTASRWTFATLDVGPELVQNVLSQLDKENPAGFDGWFASTKLGTMLSAEQGAIDPETGLPLTAGSGFFVGETVEKEQERRAREVRGAINGAGWTLGRGAASSIFRPGTKPYSIASGLIDAVILIGADPTVVGGKVAGTVKAGRAVIQGVKSADELNALRKVFRGEAGFLDDAERAVVEGSKFLRFWDRHRDASRLVDRLADAELDDPVEILRDVFKGKMDLETAGRFADATSRDEVLDILLDVTNRLDEANPNLLVTDIRDIPGSRFSYDRVPLWNTVRHSRAFTEMPEQLVIYGTDADNTNAVVNLANYLDTIRGGFTRTEEGRSVMRQVFDAYRDGSKAALDAADEAYDAVAETLIRNVYTEKAYDKALDRARSLNPEATADELDVFARTAIAEEIAEADGIVKSLRDGLQAAKDETRAYFVGQEGKAVDNGFVQALLDLFPELRQQFPDLSPEQLKELKLMGPTSVIELLDRVKILPDIRAVRRVTGNTFMRRALSRKDADPRSGVAIAEYLQNQIWKPLTLMTGGYIARNMLDAQVRIATVGLAGAFNHPWAWMQWAMFRKAPGDITGENFKVILRQAVDNAREAATDPDEFYEALTFSLRRNLEDPTNAIYGQRTGSYKVVSRTDNRDEWFNGLIEELEQIAKDTMFNASAKGIGSDDMLDYLRNTEKGQKVLEVFKRYLENGFDTVDNAGYSRKLKLDYVDDDVLRLWISRLIEPRVALKTGSDDQIAVAVGYRRIPIGRSQIVSVDEIAGATRVTEGPEKIGRGYQFRTVDDEGKEAVSVVLKVIDEPASGQQFVEVQRLSQNDWIDTVEGKAEFRNFLEERVKQIELDPQSDRLLPKWTKLAEKAVDAREQSAFTRAANRITDGFFVGFYGMLTQKFERSPVFRQFYYEQVAKNADLLSREAGRELVDQIIRKAKEFKVSPAAYVGGRSNWAKIQKTALSATGDGAVDQLDEFAKVVALNKTKETLYNASSRNNLEDMMRILIPFGVAHREVLATYMKFVIQDPTRIRRAQLAYKGFENFDPDADGQGFFYKDPTTGESTFNFPLSGELAKLLTGVEAPLAAPVKRLSLGLQVVPGIGPMAQIAASNLIPDVPETDGIVSLLLPYGRRSFNVMPAWSVKLKEAIQADPTKLETTYANTYVDTLRALVASGDYDTSDPQQEANLYEDARKKAQILATMRAIAQFTGPAAPSNEFIVSTKNEDMYASAMVQELYRMQNENYDTAAQRFIETFGNDAFIYLSSKSQSVAGGLEASEQFGDWERKNGDLLRQYPEVAAFFAPSGDDFSFEVWSRQFRTGRRRRLTDKEVLEQAQYRMGSAIYRSYKDQVGAYPSQEQREWLRGIRREIHKRYRGFPEIAVFEVGKFDDEVAKLRLLVDDSRLQGNEIRNSVATYLDYRDQAVSRYVSSGGKPGGFDTAKAAQPLRDYLVSIGMALMQQNPDFGRVWERVLSSEVER
jgi:hypothetical protein